MADIKSIWRTLYGFIRRPPITRNYSSMLMRKRRQVEGLP